MLTAITENPTMPLSAALRLRTAAATPSETPKKVVIANA